KTLLEGLLRLWDDVHQGQRDATERQVLVETRDHLEDAFLLVIAGEFNAGKSSLLNAIVGSEVMTEGATPTTDAVTMLRYAPQEMAISERPGWVIRALPVPLLQRMSIVDTPGTNAVLRHHEVLTREIVPRADAVLFITSADRPFSETERAFLAMLKDWRRHVVIVVNKIDLLNETEHTEVLTFVREQATALFGESPLVLPISVRRWRAGDEVTSGFTALWEYLNQRLDDRMRMRIRLESPLGISDQVVKQARQAIQTQRQSVNDDVQAVAYLQGQITQFAHDLRRDVQGHHAAVQAILSDTEVRGMRFFDEYIRFRHLHRLLKGDELEQLFAREVAADLADHVEERTQVMVDWLIERNLQLWQHVSEYVYRRARTTDSLLPEGTAMFQYRRQALIDDIVTTANDIVASYDRNAEAAHVANELRQALATTAVIQVGAIGVGAIIATALKGAVFDTTGVIAASVIALGGLYIIPARRTALKNQLQQRMAEVRQALLTQLTQQFEAELTRMQGRITDAIGPYTRLVATEVDRLEQAHDHAQHLDDEIAEIRAMIRNQFR
ncbi:MAG: dynamin, partial [Chloroflexi bacterium]|nr:dynamin [Chloroflexota bacterium]